jgi:uncharacterized Zn-binding protein involved in type VI secretion
VVRAEVDKHIGHASPTPNDFHQFAYTTSNTTVFANGYPIVRSGDKTECGDPVVGTSSNVYVEGELVHRQGDATGGHGSWVPNAAATGSGDVIANGS